MHAVTGNAGALSFHSSPFFSQSNAKQNLTTLAGRSSKDVLIAGFAARKRGRENEGWGSKSRARAQLQPKTRVGTRNLSTISNDLSGQIARRTDQISRHSLIRRTDPRFTKLHRNNGCYDTVTVCYSAHGHNFNIGEQSPSQVRGNHGKGVRVW